jgi:hypothetical protein
MVLSCKLSLNPIHWVRKPLANVSKCRKNSLPCLSQTSPMSEKKECSRLDTTIAPIPLFTTRRKVVPPLDITWFITYNTLNIYAYIRHKQPLVINQLRTALNSRGVKTCFSFKPPLISMYHHVSYFKQNFKGTDHCSTSPIAMYPTGIARDSPSIGFQQIHPRGEGLLPRAGENHSADLGSGQRS